ncbi:MAG: hypothetical protein ACK50L_07690 [Bacteroidota bacterium]
MSINKPYFRIYRPGVFADYCTDIKNAENCAMLCRAYNLLENDLRKIFEYVEPCKHNLNTYSHRMYELFLRASTEFESNAKGILKANGYSKKDRDMKIRDYLKLDLATKLSEYQLEIGFWRPNKMVITPFAKWKEGHSLKWYQDYNAVKHNRDANFHLATLENTLESVAAVLAILYAQFDFNTLTSHMANPVIMQTDNENITPQSDTMFQVIKPHTWTADQKYQFDWVVLKSNNEPFQKFPFQI